MGIIEDTTKHVRHFTVTGYVMNKDRTKLLMIHHKKLGIWMPPGGHLEQNEVPHEGALREVFEETGVRARLVDDDEPDLALRGETEAQIPRPYGLLYERIPQGPKDTEHIHLDMLYIFEADDTAALKARREEVHGVQWYTKQEILEDNDVFDSVKGFAARNLK